LPQEVHLTATGPALAPWDARWSDSHRGPGLSEALAGLDPI